MIKNRLAIILAERGLKITRVAKDTGISRNTITATSQNDGEMIRLETINTLCKYLGVTPCEFFEFEPVDINFSLDIVSFPLQIGTSNDYRVLHANKLDADLFMDLDWGSHKRSIDLSCSLVTDFTIKEKRRMLDEEVDTTIFLEIQFDDTEDRDYFLEDIYKKVSSSFYKDIYAKLFNVVKVGLIKKVEANIDLFIEKHLDTEGVAFADQFRDNFFATDLNYIKRNLNIEIKSDVFKPF